MRLHGGFLPALFSGDLLDALHGLEKLSENVGAWFLAPFGYPLYVFLRDQGSLVAGFLALVGGTLAYAAARRQAVAVEEQNRTLAREGVRSMAREKLTAASIMAGVLSAVEREAARLELSQDSKAAETPAETASSAQRTIHCLPLLEIQSSLGQMSKEFISEYFELYDRVEVFRDRMSDADDVFSIAEEAAAIKLDAASLHAMAEALMQQCLRSLGGGHFNRLHRYHARSEESPSRNRQRSAAKSSKSKTRAKRS